jgi:hypothetical protein
MDLQAVYGNVPWSPDLKLDLSTPESYRRYFNGFGGVAADDERLANATGEDEGGLVHH